MLLRTFRIIAEKQNKQTNKKHGVFEELNAPAVT
jgi:hypothetical protein